MYTTSVLQNLKSNVVLDKFMYLSFILFKKTMYLHGVFEWNEYINYAMYTYVVFVERPTKYVVH